MLNAEGDAAATPMASGRRWMIVRFGLGTVAAVAILGVGALAIKGRLTKPRRRGAAPSGPSNPVAALVPRKWRKADAYFRSLFEKRFDPEIGLFPNTSLRWKVYS